MTTAIDIQTVQKFIKENFPGPEETRPIITRFEPSLAVCEHPVVESMLRPGRLISGPTQMALADMVAYVAIFTRLGITPMAVTSNLSIDFLRPCRGVLLIGEGRLIKLGRSLAVINVDIRGNQSDHLSSQAVVTYALPRDKN